MRRTAAAAVMISALALLAGAKPPRDIPTSTSRGPVARGFQPRRTATLKGSPCVGHHHQEPPEEISITGRVVADKAGDAVPEGSPSIYAVEGRAGALAAPASLFAVGAAVRFDAEERERALVAAHV